MLRSSSQLLRLPPIRSFSSLPSRPRPGRLPARSARSPPPVRVTPRSLSSAPGPPARSLPDKLKIFAASFVLANLALQSQCSSAADFYDYRFTTCKDPDDLAGFYGSEAFMDIFCVLPFMGTLMMRGGEFDEEGAVHTTGFPGTMVVSMVFSDDDDEEGRTVWFNKRERFKDTVFGRTMWE